MTGCQHDLPLGAGDDAVVFNVRRDQVDLATHGAVDGAFVLDGAGYCTVAKLILAAQKIGIAHLKRGGD